VSESIHPSMIVVASKDNQPVFIRVLPISVKTVIKIIIITTE